MEMARSMIKDKGLSNTFWAEVVYTTVYILNICPTKVINDKNPKQLRIFESICYILVLDQKTRKLEDM